MYASQLIRYARACSAYDQFLNRGKLLTDKLLLFQGFQQSRLKAAFRRFYGRYNNLVYQYDLSLSQMLSDVFHTPCKTVVSIPALTTGNRVNLISSKGSRRV